MKKENRICYNKEFDKKYQYDGRDLGATCGDDKTEFKLWSPLADKVIVRLYSDGEIDSAKTEEYIMESLEKGVFGKEIQGDLHGMYYDYEITRGTDVIVTADPYAVSCGCNGSRSMVTNLARTNPEGFEEDHMLAPDTEQIIYELHVKDFSHDVNSGIPAEYRGKFKAFTVEHPDSKYTTCIAHLKELGVTHVHLLPFYDFAALDENGSDDQFNWGYDPLNYNIPEGSFATDSHDGSVRVRECKEMVQALHKAGIRVVMDVVYNHTFSADSWLERTVPGYYCRRNADGSLCNGSACGSDMAVGRAMVDNYIVDSVLYWAREYHLDGFRFDLMGLLTVELMNRIRKELDAAYGENKILLYGEPWRAAESLMEEGTHAALKENLPLLDENIAVFSDDIRDVVKGDVFIAKEPGFVNGEPDLEEKVLASVAAWRKGGGSVEPKSASQIVSYVSAHDNFTLWDKLVITMRDEKELEDTSVYTQKHEDVLAANKLAALMYFSCQGHVFFQAGEEFGRTKLGDENSYRSDPKINMLNWKQTEEFSDLLDYYKGLIALRKSTPGLYDKSADAYKRISMERVHEAGVVSFALDNRTKSDSEADSWNDLFFIFNASKKDERVEVPEGDWTVLVDGEVSTCSYKAQVTAEGKVVVPTSSGMILAKK